MKTLLNLSLNLVLVYNIALLFYDPMKAVYLFFGMQALFLGLKVIEVLSSD